MPTAPQPIGHPESHVLTPRRPIPGISDAARIEAERRIVGRPRPAAPMPEPANDGVPHAA